MILYSWSLTDLKAFVFIEPLKHYDFELFIYSVLCYITRSCGNSLIIAGPHWSCDYICAAELHCGWRMAEQAEDTQSGHSRTCQHNMWNNNNHFTSIILFLWSWEANLYLILTSFYCPALPKIQCLQMCCPTKKRPQMALNIPAQTHAESSAKAHPHLQRVSLILCCYFG